MSADTAKAIASGVGPLIAALIAAYQLWLKPRVDEPRELPFDLVRLKSLASAIGKIRLQLMLFTLLVVCVTAIPIGGMIFSLAEIDFQASVSLPKVLVAFLATIGTVHAFFLVGRLQALGEELRGVRRSIIQKQ